MAEMTKIADDIFMIPWAEGNGVIRREVWIDSDGAASRYRLAYINEDSQAEDNAQILALNYADGALSECFKDKTNAVSFTTLEAMERHFEEKWNSIPKTATPPGGNAGAGYASMDDGDDYSAIQGMKLVITKGTASDYFRRGQELAAQLDRGERPKPEKIVMMGKRADLCHSQMPKNEWTNLRNRMAAGDMSE